MSSKRIAEQTLVVGAGKGGVGKSTVAVNLAVALAQEGKEVGLLDADIYGPSIPAMTGLRRLSPRIEKDPLGQEKVIPFSKFGVKVVSIGFFMEEARSVVWRGPMLHGALQKMLFYVEWGELDVLVIDLPPGTGDVLISLSQMTAIDGAVLVTTPQEVVILDVIKAISAFDQLSIPLLGIVENLAGFTPPGSEKVHHIFGRGRAQELARRFEAPVLGSIGIDPTICSGGDEGVPAAFNPSESTIYDAFHGIARNLIQQHHRKLSQQRL